ncbi:MAG: hypothetical protein CR972_01630 [Candidatus Moraniibacteriota bacterium]|nr:MAG: hypothetical protein CR972_01630 [Candidatus Moranbacteria bacterium]
MNKIYIVTTNKRKFEDYTRRLDGIATTEQLPITLDEGRGMDIKEITASKLDQAKKKAPHKKIIVDDRGFFISALHGFPGPFVKILLHILGIENVMKMMEDKEDRKATFHSVIGYYDGKKDYFFEDIEEGFITHDMRNGNTRGWTDLLQIYGHKRYPDRALCELNEREWDEYVKQVEKLDAWSKLVTHLKKN